MCYTLNMHESDIKENQARGITGFPLEYYYLDKYHPKYQMVSHWHLDLELIFILEGNFTLHLENTSYSLSQGDLAFIPDGLIHGGTANKCRYECIVFSPELLRHRDFLDDVFFRKVLHHHLSLIPILKKEELAKYEGFSQTLALLFSKVRKSPLNPLAITGCLKLLLSEYEQNKLFTTNLFSVKNGMKRTEQIKQVLDYIETNYDKPITLEALSEIAILSPKYFCAFFKELTGRTPFDYINLVKIEKACLLLEENEQNILEIALSCGYSDATYFSRTFRKYKNMTPKEYKLKTETLLENEAVPQKIRPLQFF